MTQTVKRLYSVEEYLALEETAKDKSEYYYGEIIPMAGSSLNHDRIAGNVYSALNTLFLDRPCEVFTSDMKLLVKVGQDYTYPDVMALCGQVQLVAGRSDIITNPSVIIEVLSKSTQNADRTSKFERYKTVESVQNYVLIAQKQVYIECYQKLTDGTWHKQNYTDLNQNLDLAALQVEIPLARIYSKVNFSLK